MPPGLPVTRQLLTGCARETLGALLANCGGVLIEHGGSRLLGGGAPHLPNLLDANLNAPHSTLAYLVIGFDVAGGRFAINGTGNRAAAGEVCYFVSDTLEWLPLGFGHDAFLSWALSSDLGLFYQDLRWANWQDTVRRFATDHAVASYPPFAFEAHGGLRVIRTSVPYQELLDFIGTAAQQLADVRSSCPFDRGRTQPGSTGWRRIGSPTWSRGRPAGRPRC